MTLKVRAELSEKNKYWIERHRYHELKHFCMQYPIWKKALNAISMVESSKMNTCCPDNKNVSDHTAVKAEARIYYTDRIDMLERISKEADPDLAKYILKGVNEGVPYDYLKAKLDIPCCKDTYYDRYRRFFWLLNKERG